MEELETNGYYVLGIPAYLLVILLEIAVTRYRGLSSYTFSSTLSNLAVGIGALFAGLLLAPGLLGLYRFGYQHLAIVYWPDGSLLEWPCALLLSDLCYYVYHRAGHRIGIFWAIHGVHHQPERFNMTVAMRMPWMSDLYSFPFYAPLPILGFHQHVFFACIALISFYALTVHSHAFHRPSFGLLVTPESHIVHHARNPRYLGKNLGAMFTLWDRLFGTHEPLLASQPPLLGAEGGNRTHDALAAQGIFFRDLLQRAASAGSLWDKLSVFVSRPGYRPPGVPRPPEQPALSEPDLGLREKTWILSQFAFISLLGTWVLWDGPQGDLVVQGVCMALVLWGIRAMGGLLDGRRHAKAEEALRICVSAALLAALSLR